MGLAYVVSVLDRGNISFAALSMNRELGFTATVFGWGTGIFYAGYLLLEVPSNTILVRVGARRWIARIMVTWGICSGLTALTSGPLSFYAYRFLLGAAEAGFLPGVMYYLRQWFPQAYRMRIMSAFLLFIPFTTAISAPLSLSIMKLDGSFGLRGWQWLFVLEALPSVILGVVTWFALPDRIGDASFLSANEKTALLQVLDQEAEQNADRQIHDARKVFIEVRCWALGIINLSIIICVYALSYWLPQITRGYGVPAAEIGWWVALPHACGIVGMYCWGRLSKQNGESIWNIVIPCVVGGVGLFAAAESLATPAVATAAFCVAGFGLYAAIPAFWGIPPTILGGGAAASGLAFINTIGSFSGLIGPVVIGYIKDRTQSFRGGLVAMDVFLLVGVLLLVMIRARMWPDVAASEGQRDQGKPSARVLKS
ncbi:MFS transporter [Paraburkholderia xenovorans]